MQWFPNPVLPEEITHMMPSAGVRERRAAGAGGAPAQPGGTRAARPQGSGSEREEERWAHSHPAAGPLGSGPQ